MKKSNIYSLTVTLFITVFIGYGCSSGGTEPPICPDPDNPECPLPVDTELFNNWISERTCAGSNEAKTTLKFTPKNEFEGKLNIIGVDCNDGCPEPLEEDTEWTWTQKDDNTITRTLTGGKNCQGTIPDEELGFEKDSDYLIKADTLIWGDNLAIFFKEN